MPNPSYILLSTSYRLSAVSPHKMLLFFIVVFKFLPIVIDTYLLFYSLFICLFIQILWTVHERDDAWATWPGMSYVWFVVHWLAMSHCCYNPIIYCYMNKRYRRRFKQVNTITHFNILITIGLYALALYNFAKEYLRSCKLIFSERNKFLRHMLHLVCTINNKSLFNNL